MERNSSCIQRTEVPYGDQTFDFGKPFEKLTMREAIKKYRPETEMADLDNFDSAKAIAESIGIHVEKSWGLGRIVTEIFEEVAEAHLIQPTFITEYPAEVSPLARRNDENPEITDRFEFFIGGREIGNGFSELIAAVYAMAQPALVLRIGVPCPAPFQRKR